MKKLVAMLLVFTGTTTLFRSSRGAIMRVRQTKVRLAIQRLQKRIRQRQLKTAGSQFPVVQ